ncbi:hypothetical protein Mnod_8817 (plasmid) [Methylobacterium nodulans ORS 2060]|uniref:Uncharacterized protein n=1 Tax=Methylobacterium nodulans (strain LMG 21967 / CNCM I-2342 / ORS 2060) TaxID=460265 RepID=B8IXY2_METNO|nr:hypothetical protein Mnod_8817 [Methylobacterium nodulans ORS 2060]
MMPLELYWPSSMLAEVFPERFRNSTACWQTDASAGPVQAMVGEETSIVASYRPERVASGRGVRGLGEKARVSDPVRHNHPALRVIEGGRS